MSQPPPGYRFFAIDPRHQTPDLPALAQNYKVLRLSALKLSPNSFSATYASQSALPDSEWVARLSTLGKTLFVCSTMGASPEDEEFASVLTMIGPVTSSDFTLAPEAGQPPIKADDIEQRWHLTGLYTLPSHRGNSLGRKLSQYAIAQLRAATAVPELRVRLMAAPTNILAVKMYEGMGLQHSGKCTMEEAMYANRELDDLPGIAEFEGDGETAEALRRRFRTRGGFVMEIRV